MGSVGANKEGTYFEGASPVLAPHKVLRLGHLVSHLLLEDRLAALQHTLRLQAGRERPGSRGRGVADDRDARASKGRQGRRGHRTSPDGRARRARLAAMPARGATRCPYRGKGDLPLAASPASPLGQQPRAWSQRATRRTWRPCGRRRGQTWREGGHRSRKCSLRRASEPRRPIHVAAQRAADGPHHCTESCGWSHTRA